MTPLRKIRHHKNLTLSDLATAVGSDTGSLSRIETGETVPKKDLTARLAAHFAPDITELHIIYPERYVDWSPPAANIAPLA